jgi:hypothetical protein
MSPYRRALRIALLPTAFGLIMADAITGADQADACSIAAVFEHEIDSDDPDEVAPGEVSPVSVLVDELAGLGGCEEQGSCAGIGIIGIVVRAEDNATPVESIGFTIELVSGFLPD